MREINVSVQGIDMNFQQANTVAKSIAALHDEQGHEHLCLAEHLRDPNNPQQEACFRINENKEAPAACMKADQRLSVAPRLFHAAE